MQTTCVHPEIFSGFRNLAFSKNGPARQQHILPEHDPALQGVDPTPKRLSQNPYSKIDALAESVVIMDIQLVSFEALYSLHRGRLRCALKPCGGTPWILVGHFDKPVLYRILMNVI